MCERMCAVVCARMCRCLCVVCACLALSVLDTIYLNESAWFVPFIMQRNYFSVICTTTAHERVTSKKPMKRAICTYYTCHGCGHACKREFVLGQQGEKVFCMHAANKF